MRDLLRRVKELFTSKEEKQHESVEVDVTRIYTEDEWSAILRGVCISEIKDKERKGDQLTSSQRAILEAYNILSTDVETNS